MRVRLPSLAAPAALLALGLSACGGGAPASRVASVSVSVPVANATLFVSRIHVEGTVSAGVASVRVAGHRVRVHRGSFSALVHLRHGRNRIHVLAGLPGAPVTDTEVTVRYGRDRTGGAPSLADRVNASCVAASQQGALAQTPTTAAGVVRSLRRTLVHAQRAEARAARYTPPPALATPYAAWLASQRQEITALADYADAISAHSRAALLAALHQLVAAGHASDTLSQRLGFLQCLSLGDIAKRLRLS